MKLYGAAICPDCVRAKKALDEKGLEYTYVDITENTYKMKEFLRLRDSRKEFIEKKEAGLIGIPAFLFTDGSLLFELEDLDYKKIEEDKDDKDEQEIGLCGLDGC